MVSLLSRIKRLLGADADLAETVRGVSGAFVMKVAGMFCGYLFALVVSRSLGADAWGTFSLSLTVLTLAGILGRMGLDTALVRLVAEKRGTGDTAEIAGLYARVLAVAAPLGLVLSGAVYLLADEIAAGIFSKPHLGDAFRIAALGVLPTVLTFINTQALRGVRRVQSYVFLNFVARHLFALIGFLVLSVFVAGGNGQLPIVAFVVSVWLGTAISFFLVLRREEFRGGLSAPSVAMKRVFGIAVPLLLANSTGFLKGWIDTIMLGIYMTEQDVGIYNVALKLAALAGLSLVAVNAVAAPRFAEHYGRGDHEGLARAVQRATKMVFAISAPILVVLFLLPRPILGMFGAEFEAGAVALLLLAGGQLANATAGTVGTLLNMTGRQVAYQNITIAVTGLNILLNYLLIPPFGLVGAGVATLVGMVAWNGSCVAYAHFHLDIRALVNPIAMVRK